MCMTYVSLCLIGSSVSSSLITNCARTYGAREVHYHVVWALECVLVNDTGQEADLM